MPQAENTGLNKKMKLQWPHGNLTEKENKIIKVNGSRRHYGKTKSTTPNPEVKLKFKIWTETVR